MMDTQPFDPLPVWSVYFLTVIFLYLATEPGFRFGKLVQKRWPDGAEIGVGTMVALYVQSLKQVVDLHTERVNAELGFRVPPIIMLGLYIVSIMTMVLTGFYDSEREKHNLIA